MKITIAAAAPELLPGQPGRNMANIRAAVTRAQEEGASILVLPSGFPEDLDREAITELAGKMKVYPITHESLPRGELLHHHEGMDILCCSASTPASVSSHHANVNLAGLASHENMAVVVMACPMGGDGGVLYTGQCIIAQNGTILQNADGYVSARVSIPSREKSAPVEDIVSDQPHTPWTPLPEELPRVLKLQADGLARRMMALGTTQLTVNIDRTASSLLALASCVQAVDKLKLSRKNIHVTADGNRANRIAAALGVTVGGQNGLIVDSTDLTTRVLEGVTPQHYDLNATVPRSVARLVMRWYANTCGDTALSVPIRSICLDDNAKPWALYDFLLHFSLVYDLPKWTQARLLEDTFEEEFSLETIQQALDVFFDTYRRPVSCDGPAVFSLDVRPPAEA